MEPLIAALECCVIPLDAVTAVGKIGDVRAVEPLIAILKDVKANARDGAR